MCDLIHGLLFLFNTRKESKVDFTLEKYSIELKLMIGKSVFLKEVKN
jgi:hypothetical protein